MAITFTGDEVCVGGITPTVWHGRLLTAPMRCSQEESVGPALDPKSESIPLVLDTKGGVCGENYINDCGVLSLSHLHTVHIQHRQRPAQH